MSDVESTVEDTAEDAAEEVQNGDGGGIAKKLVTPAAVGLGTLAAGYALKKGPQLLKDKVMPLIENKGEEEAEDLGRSAAEGAVDQVQGQGGIAGKAVGMFSGGDDNGGSSQARGWGRGRRLPVQASIDVAVPPSKAFRAWSDFEKLPEFMHRVESVDAGDDDKITWTENIWGISRTWDAEITERRPNQVIAWRSKSRGGHAGVVTFHKLSDRLTRVEVNIDFQPQGLFEKMSSGLQFHRRALKTDLKRFKAYVEMTENADADAVVEEEEQEQEQQPSAEASSESQSKDGAANADDEDNEEDRQKRQERREKRRSSSS